MADPKPAAPAASKYNTHAIIAWVVVAIVACFAIYNGIRAEDYAQKYHFLGETTYVTNNETGTKTDYVYINFGAPVYEDVGSSQPLGTFYSQLSEKEFLKFLDENNIVIGVPYDAQSAPSEEDPMYRIIGENFWVKIVAPEETEIPTT